MKLPASSVEFCVSDTGQDFFDGGLIRCGRSTIFVLTWLRDVLCSLLRQISFTGEIK